MAAEQEHGNQFEHLVLTQSGLYRTGVYKENHTAPEDARMEHTQDGIALSIKTVQWAIDAASHRPVIALADAVRFHHATMDAELRVITGLHHPTPAGPLIYAIHECVLRPDMERGLWGELHVGIIKDFSQKIKAWAKEDDENNIAGRKVACERAKAHKRYLLPAMGHIDLSPKISANEARLQCSIPLFALHRECLNAGAPAHFTNALQGATAWRTIALPLQLRPGKRQHTQRAAQ